MPRATDRSRWAPQRGWFVERGAALTAPGWSDLAAEAGALLRDLARLADPAAVSADLPKGDGHAVLVLPALFGGDLLTRGFRSALAELGYEVEGWGAGINFGPTPAAWDIAVARLRAAAARSGRPVSLVGHSLGGVLARGMAFEHPQLVRHVVTICSPFRLPTASRLAPLYRLLSRWHIEEEVLSRRLAAPPPVPTTAIYSPRDGVVAWSSCIDVPGPSRENVEIDGRHSTMLAHPETIRAVAERLARRRAANPPRHGAAFSKSL